MLPVWWGKNQSGMQAAEELTGQQRINAEMYWLAARDVAVGTARQLAGPDVNLHTQISNRVVEPWMFTTVICTATEWDNARALRANPQAQPEFERTMRKAFDLYDASTPQELKSGQWHLPYVTGYDEFDLREKNWKDEDLCLVSTGRCARVSYLTHDGQRDPKADVAFGKERLIPSGHMSPTEHPLQAMTHSEWVAYAQSKA